VASSKDNTVIKSKSLTPTALGLDGFCGTRSELINKIPWGKLSPQTSQIFKEVIESNFDYNKHKDFIKIYKNHKAIFADGGEIIVPLILTVDNPTAVIAFPDTSNSKIYDVFIDGQGYAVKLNKGATTSMNQEPILNFLNENKDSNQFIGAILKMATMSTKEGRIAAFNYLGLPGHKFANSKDLKNALSLTSWREFKQKYPVYAKASKKALKAFTEENYNNPKIRENFVYWAMGRLIDQAFQGEGNGWVTKAAQQIPGNYAHFNPKTMEVFVAPFSERKYRLVHHQGLKVSCRNKAPFSPA
jgi:hypothetical protein